MPSPTEPQPPSAAPGFKHIWPIPALVLATGMLAAGAYVARSGRPKPPPDIPLEQAKALVQERRYQEAIEALNSAPVRNYLDFGDPAPTPEHWQAFYLARARAFAGAQATLNISRTENHASIIEDYAKAEKYGLELDPADVAQLCESLVQVGRIDDALTRIDTLPGSELARKSRLTRMVIEHNLERDERPVQTLELLGRLSSDPALSPAERAWILARQAETLLAADQPVEAINKLIRRIGIVKDVPTELQGELYLLLGKAYFQDEQPQQAVKQLQAADGLLPAGSPLRAELGVMLGRLLQSGVASEAPASGIDTDGVELLERAKERFEQVIHDFSGNRARPRAMLGLAEVEAALRNDDAALKVYAELVEFVRAAPPAPAAAAPAATPALSIATEPGQTHTPPLLGAIDRQSVHTSMMLRFAERFDAGLKESALRYAQLAETIYPDDQTPPEILLGIGRTHRALADAIMAQAREGHAEKVAAGAEGVNPDFSVEDLDPATRAEVKTHFLAAGDYLRRHARAATSTDPSSAASSLWTAADSFDRAGDLDEARKAFADYAESASDVDPQKAAAKYRLAQVYQARRDYSAAAALYRGLIQTRDTPDARGAGSWADASMVPLARCLLDDTDPANDAEAERLLVSVVDGSTMSPEASAYRDALVELGAVAMRTGRHAEAVGWLEMAAKRYQSDKRIEKIRFRLADAHRMEAIAIARPLSGQKLPQSQSDELENQRVEHLRAARSLYDTVRVALEAKDARTLSGLERIHLRNAYFSIGDCAMEMRDFDAAIAAYDAARLKYADDPASLVAMAQIVSAYAAQEKWAEARTANERARQQLARFPESAWSSPDLPMEKRHWERWLEARTLLEQRASARQGEN